MIEGGAPIITLSYQSLSLALSILAYSRKTLHESSKILVEHAQLDALIVSNPGLIAVRLIQRAQLWPAVYQ